MGWIAKHSSRWAKATTRASQKKVVSFFGRLDRPTFSTLATPLHRKNAQSVGLLNINWALYIVIVEHRNTILSVEWLTWNQIESFCFVFHQQKTQGCQQEQKLFWISVSIQNFVIFLTSLSCSPLSPDEHETWSVNLPTLATHLPLQRLPYVICDHIIVRIQKV